MQDGQRIKDPVVDDPLPYLDHLLFEVMRSGDPNQPIDPTIPRGFANGGIGFFAVVRGALPFPPFRFPSEALLPEFHIPEPLVVNGHWTRPPEGAKEQFYHFIWCLRQTMRALAQYPLGKRIETTPVEVARLLTTLQNRVALVRSGEDVGMIRTDDHPPALRGDDLTARQAGVQAHTRATYCRARTEVEAEHYRPGWSSLDQPAPAVPRQSPATAAPPPGADGGVLVGVPDEAPDTEFDEDAQPTTLDLRQLRHQQQRQPQPAPVRPSRWVEIDE